MQIEPINDPSEIARILAMSDEVVEKPWHLKQDWVALHNWVAVPVESASHFYERDAELLSQAMASLGCSECFAVATERLENSILFYRVLTTLDGLLEFSHETTALNFVLLPDDRSFAVLCTSEDYYIVAGPRNFVAKAVGTTIDTARKMFLRFADDQTWPESERQRL